MTARSHSLVVLLGLLVGCEDARVDADATWSSSSDATTGVDDESSTIGDEGTSTEDGDGGGAQNEPPRAVLVVTVDETVEPKLVTFDASASSDADGTIVAYEWELPESNEQEPLLTTPLGIGCHDVELTITDDDDATDTASTTIVIAAGAPEVPAVVTLEVAPLPSAVLPRNLDTNHGVASFGGVIESNGYTELRAELLDGESIRATHAIALCGAAPLRFALDVPIPAELTAFDVRLSLVATDLVHEVARATDLVAGDIYLVNGQSNAAANPQAGVANEDQGPFIRSFGIRTDDPIASDTDRAWRIAEGDGGAGPGSVGQWALRMGAQMVATHGIPVAVINGARGGMPTAFFQRNDDAPRDPDTNYGRLLLRTHNAGIAGSIRAILLWQGEADGTDFAAHRAGFHALKADWAEDYPGVERVYVTQIRYGDCGGYLIRTQEVQRMFADEFSDVEVMSSNGLDGHDGCHYTYDDGYRDIGDRYAALLGRDLYGDAPAHDVAAPNPASARFANGGTAIIVTMRNPASTLTCDPGANADFVIHAGGDSSVSSCVASGHELILGVTGDASAATGINYLGHGGAGPWITNENGVAMLSFWKVPIDPE